MQSSKTRLSQPILWALEPSCQNLSANEFYHQTVVKSWKKQLFIFPNSLTIHQTSTLHNTFYFNNTWTKIRSDPVNMQPDKTKCYPQIPITMLWPAASKRPSTSSGSPLHYTWRGTAGFGGGGVGVGGGVLECHISHHRATGMSCCSQANIRRGKGKMWWLIEICINCVVHRSFDGYHELSGD